MKYITTILSILLLKLCNSATITELALQTPQVSTLVGALVQNNLVDMFNSTDANYTVFAPTNEAFMKAGYRMDGTNVDLQLLTAHVVSGIAMSSQLVMDAKYPTLAMNYMMQPYNLTYKGNGMFMDEAGLMISVNMTNITADNGVIHLINDVIFPGNVINYLMDSKSYSFSQLLSVATPTVATALSTPGALTLFAPVDSAFAGVDPAIIGLLAANPDKLEQLLLFHTTSPIVFEETVIAGSPLDVTSGNAKNSMFTITVNAPDNITIDDAIKNRNPECMIIGTDYRRGNGIVHVIDCVITDENLVDVIQAEGLTSLAGAATTAGLVETLQSQGMYTVFGPDNAAFATAEPILATLTPEDTKNVLLYHVLPMVVPASFAITLDNAVVTTALMMNITVDYDDTTMTVNIMDNIGNTVMVTMTDKFALNGVVHVINGILIPIASVTNTLLAKQTTNALGGVISFFGLTDLFIGGPNGITFLSPNNNVITPQLQATLGSISGRLSTEILLYHATMGKVLSTQLPATGEMITMNNGRTIKVDKTNGVKFIGTASNASVIEADIICTDGIIHVLDNVLLPFDISMLMNITGTAKSVDSLSTLVTALETAGLDTTLEGSNNQAGYTVFAPPNSAFDMLPGGVLQTLLADTQALTNVLLSHVINMTLLASDIMMKDGLTIPTMSGEMLTITVDAPMVKLTDSRNVTYTVIKADIFCTNGVVHKIDKVIVDADLYTTTAAPAPTDDAKIIFQPIYIAMVILFFIFYN